MNGHPTQIDIDDMSGVFPEISLVAKSGPVLKLVDYIVPCDRIRTYVEHSVNPENLKDYY